jgi:hypothetical protein
VECLAVFAHLRKQVAGEGADSIGVRGVGADEDNEVVMGVCMEQTGKLLLARNQQIRGGLLEFSREISLHGQLNDNMVCGRLGLLKDERVG